MDAEHIGGLPASGRFEFSRHARVRAVERDISAEEIRQAGQSIEIVEDYPEDKYSASCLVLGFAGAGRPLHMQVCYTENAMLKVITLYEPQAEEWVDFRMRRQ